MGGDMGRCRTDVPWRCLLAFVELLDRKLKKDRADILESVSLSGDLGDLGDLGDVGGCFDIECSC
jgi:hypothetical protein